LITKRCLRNHRDGLLVSEKDTQESLTRVAALIEGYETPYALELLSTVHWVVVHDAVAGGRDKFSEAVVDAVHAWNAHKRKTFTPQRISTAWQRLKSECWF
jgi:hypothetical protein